VRFVLVLILGGVIGFGTALWFQGEPPFAGGPSGGRGDMTIVLSDRYLTQLAGPVIAARSHGLLSRVRIASTSGDTAFVRASGHVAGAIVPAGVSLSLAVVGGSLQLNVRSAHVGPVPVPGVVVSPLLDAIDAKVKSLVSNSGFVISGAGTTESGVEVYLKPA